MRSEPRTRTSPETSKIDDWLGRPYSTLNAACFHLGRLFNLFHFQLRQAYLLYYHSSPSARTQFNEALETLEQFVGPAPFFAKNGEDEFLTSLCRIRTRLLVNFGSEEHDGEVEELSNWISEVGEQYPRGALTEWIWDEFKHLEREARHDVRSHIFVEGFSCFNLGRWLDRGIRPLEAEIRQRAQKNIPTAAAKREKENRVALPDPEIDVADGEEWLEFDSAAEESELVACGAGDAPPLPAWPKAMISRLTLAGLGQLSVNVTQEKPESYVVPVDELDNAIRTILNSETQKPAALTAPWPKTLHGLKSRIVSVLRYSKERLIGDQIGEAIGKFCDGGLKGTLSTLSMLGIIDNSRDESPPGYALTDKFRADLENGNVILGTKGE